MGEKVLFVDDEINVLSAFRRQMRKDFPMDTALGPQEGLEAVTKRGPFAVVVSDLRMPGMDGIAFLARVRELAPDTVRMMLTGHADLQAAITAVNEGNIFQFLTKPCHPDILSRAVLRGIEQYRLVTAERQLLEETLKGGIKVLADVLAMVNPEAFGRSNRIMRHIIDLARHLGAGDVWKLETAAMLSQIGCVILPDETLRKLRGSGSLSPDEMEIFRKHPAIGSQLLAQIPRMEEISEIIAYQEKHFDGSGIPPDARRGKEIPLGSRMLKVLLDFDALEVSGLSRRDALAEMSGRDGVYDPEVLSALKAVLGVERKYRLEAVTVAQLKPRMLLAQDVLSDQGHLLISRGQEVSPALIERLRNFAQTAGIVQPLRVVVPLLENPGEAEAS